MSVIRADGLTKIYGRTAAVDELDFEIEAGEIVGFLGPNGGVPPQRIDEALAFVRMQNAADKKVKAYSQGMRQRLGLARALLHDPKVLLLDEPTNGLDPVGIAEFRERLRETARRGVTILVSSHILAEIEKLVDRVIAIERGRLIFDGPLGALVRRLDLATVVYHLVTDDRDALVAALEALGYEPSLASDEHVSVIVPEQESKALLARLAERGVAVLEARREQDDLEDAYLKLLQEDGQPV